MAVAEAVKGVSLRLTPRPRRPVNQSAHHVHPSWTAFAPPRFPTCEGNAGLMLTLLLPLARSGSPASHLEPGMYQSLFPHPSVLVNFQTLLVTMLRLLSWYNTEIMCIVILFLNEFYENSVRIIGTILENNWGEI